ncbi:synaptotagmin-like protein 2 isoform X2 [Nothobranchius furzeri]|uniref:Transcript variant X2 n=1 Tax=Nothobranchius furzeri TaxID=105023 RepID=A0A9D2XQ59_NOTFU|nr:transcript variant X2 [Nothobranchius furzeri]
MEQQGKVESRNHQKLQQETTATMIDLSFLTEEEQESIRAVLKRDADLKRVEEKRIQNLQSTVADKRLLKYLTGEWFYKAKQHRHQDRIHGSDIIRASMRKTNKPLTLLELCNMPPERSSFVSSENRDVIIPPVLSGILEVPEVRTGSDGSQAHSTHEAIHSPQKTVSPSKLRNNPFNQFMDADADKDLRPQAAHGEISSPNSSALKRLSSRNMMSSKSLEELTSQTTASLPTVMKTSFSTLGLQKKEMDSDSLLQKTPNSSMSNLSLSSGMASLSSVSSSMTSVHTIDSGGVEVQGTIQFAVNYIQKTGELQIFVVLCRGLVIADVKKNRSDPYVKCYLLPDKTRLGKRKSSVRKKTVNPTYNEILKFKVTMEELKKQNLNISVWHNDPLGRNSFLGEVGLDLSKWDFNNTELNEYILKSRASAQTSACPRDKGQMRVGLRFVPHTSHSKGSSRPEAGELLIWVKDCRNLPPSINPFVKCTVLPDMSQKSRQQTRVVKNTANPMFNHTMVYDGFQPEDLKETCVELTVWDHVRLKNHFVGGVRLGPGTGRSYGVEVAWMDSAANEVTLWHQMLRSNGEWVEDVLPLRMLVMAKRMSKSS